MYIFYQIRHNNISMKMYVYVSSVVEEKKMGQISLKKILFGRNKIDFLF